MISCCTSSREMSQRNSIVVLNYFPLTVSGPVEGLTANITHNSTSETFSISISWSEPFEPNGVITQYRYTVSNSDTGATIVNDSTTSTDTEVVDLMLSGAEPYTNYTVTVVPVNSDGDGMDFTITVLSPQTGKLVKALLGYTQILWVLSVQV